MSGSSFTRLGNLLGWGLVPLAVLLQLVWLKRPLPIAGGALTAELLVLAAIAVASTPWLWARRSEIGRPGVLLGASFLAIVAYAAASSAVHPDPRAGSPAIAVGKQWVLVPLATAAVTLVAGMGLVLAAERRLRPLICGIAGVALVVSGLATWPREIAVHGDPRLATAMGGAATIHVVFLFVAAIGFGLFSSGKAKVLGGILALAGVFCVLATLSRAGLIALVAWAAILVVGQLLRGRQSRVVLSWIAACAAAIAAAFAIVPALSRSISFADPKRAANLEASLTLWTRSPLTVVFGTGTGQVWPWFAFDSGILPIREDTMTSTEAGNVLLSPHSTVLAIAVELGIVGLLFAVVALVAVIAMLRRVRNDAWRFPLAAALVASLATFLFDTYLLRNFGVSLWWWIVAALCCSSSAVRGPSAGSHSP